MSLEGNRKRGSEAAAEEEDAGSAAEEEEGVSSHSPTARKDSARY